MEARSRGAFSRRALPVLLRTPMLAAAIPCGFLAVGLGFVYAGATSAGPFDTAVSRMLPDDRPFALVLDWIGEPAGFVATIALFVGLCFLARRPRVALVVLAAQAVVGVTCLTVKSIVERTIHSGWLSYPSGHTAVVTVFGIVAGMILVDLLRLSRVGGGVLVFGLALGTGAAAGWAQASLSAHYPSDTIGGFLVAMALVPPVALLSDRLVDRVIAS